MRKSKTLQLFADEVEDQLVKGGTSLVLQVCRHIVGDNPKVSAFMTAKLVEWSLGKAKETVKVEGYVEHTIFDTSRLTDEQLREAERLVESASVGSDKG